MMDRRSVLKALTVAGMALGGAWASPAVTVAKPPCAAVTSGTSYATVQEAVDAAAPGATVRIKGTCYGDVSITKNVRLEGRSKGRSATINGGNSYEGSAGSVIVNHGATVVIRDLEITGGVNGVCFPASAPECEDKTSSETIAEKGGGIFNERGSITLIDAVVTGNEATSGREHPVGSSYGGGGIYNEEGALTLKNSTVSGNKGIGKGGGIDNEEGSLTLIASTVEGNETTDTARGIGGEACLPGGGIFNTAGAVVVATRSTISNNRGGGDYCDGGGILNAGSFTLDRSTVRANQAYTGGGISNRGTMTLSHSAVTGNVGQTETALGSAGGGIANGGSLTLDGSIVSGNEASDGGGLSNGGSVTLNNSTVTGNTAFKPGAYGLTETDHGGGIYNGHELILNGSSSVTGNAAAESGGGIFNEESGGATISYAPDWHGAISGNTPDDIFNG
jgi:hypothetical protein